MRESKTKGKNDLRVRVAKTYKLLIGGALVRSESGRYLRLIDPRGRHAGNICRASRKDLRNAVQAARKAWPAWQGLTSYNRAQILYRMAENLESRGELFTGLLRQYGHSSATAKTEFTKAVDRLVYFAGWCDKYIQVFSSVNPVSGNYFNFSYPEPTGVVAMTAPSTHGLLGPVSMLAPALAGGNCCVLLAGESWGALAIELADVVLTSDVPSGAINLLTGNYDELASYMASHMDINAMVTASGGMKEWQALGRASAGNVKRLHRLGEDDIIHGEHPRLVMQLQEIKTIWHPAGS